MRKPMLAVVASCAVAAVMPATALAHGHHHSRHHGRLHHRHFGTEPVSSTTPVNTAPATLSVVSFDSTTNVLIIKDASGQQITGTVTPDTRLICIPPQQPPNTSPPNTSPTGTWQGHDGGGWGGSQGGGDQNGGGNDQGDDQGQGDDEHHNQCTTADLMGTPPVLFADLSISSNGTNWDTVVLQVAPSTVPTVPDTDNDGE